MQYGRGEVREDSERIGKRANVQEKTGERQDARSGHAVL